MKNKITKLFLVLMLSTNIVHGQEGKMPDYIIKATNIDFLNKYSKDLESEFNKNYNLALEMAHHLGRPISGVKDGYTFALMGYDKETGNLLYYKTSNNSEVASSLQTANAKPLHLINIKGNGMNVGVWDGGVGLTGHNAFQGGRYIIKDNGNTPSSIEPSGKLHAAHVAGTVAAGNFGDGSTMGFATEAKVFAYNWLSDTAEMAAAAANTQTPIYTSNHSYGLDTYGYIVEGNGNNNIFGQYNSSSRLYDIIANNAPYYTIVFAAGNDRDNYNLYNPNKGGRDLLSQAGVSKNVVVVASTRGTEDFSGITGPNSITGSNRFISSFSNFGPTDDFRIKPDISAKGDDVKSISNLNTAATTTLSGTSMATPSVTGVFTLWQQYFNQLFGQFMRSATVRALMAHSAKEAGEAEGPDYKFGWGLIDADAGAQVLRDKVAGVGVVAELEMTQGQGLDYAFTYNGQQPLIVTIAWNDPAGNALNTTNLNIASLINDLDLKVLNVDTGQEFLPWALNHSWSSSGSNIASRMVNSRDNIERVNVNSVVPGNYKVIVNHKGNLNGGAQTFSIIISGAGNQMPELGTLNNIHREFTDLRVFPNPTSDYLVIEGESNELEGADVFIYDLAGKLVSKRQINSNINGYKIEVENLQNGIYLLEVVNKDIRQIIKFVKK